MCIRDRVKEPQASEWVQLRDGQILYTYLHLAPDAEQTRGPVSYTHLRAHETVLDLVCRLLLEKKNK